MTDRRFPTLNAVRGAGAIMVVATHAAFNTGEINRGWHGAVLARLDFGVTLFFILSGFLLARPFLSALALGPETHRSPSVRHYLWKRALRILPLYWVVVVAALTLDPENRRSGWGAWLSELTLTQLYRHGLLASSLTQMWSLCTEAAFYVLLPLLCLALCRSRRHPGLHLPTVAMRSGALALLGIVWQVAVATIPGTQGHYAQWLPSYLPWFLTGLWFAAVSVSLGGRETESSWDRIGRDLPGCWILATAVFAIACSPIAGPRLLLAPGHWEAGAKVVLYTVAGAFYVLPLVFGPEDEGRVREFLSGQIPWFLGEISYGIYAIHLLILTLVFHLFGLELFGGRFVTAFGATLVITLALATVSFYGFERRLLRFKNLPLFARLEPGPGADRPAPTPR